MDTRIVLVALVDLPTYRKAAGEVFLASRPLATALVKRGHATVMERAAGHYHTRVLTPAPHVEARPARSRRKDPA